MSGTPDALIASTRALSFPWYLCPFGLASKWEGHERGCWESDLGEAARRGASNRTFSLCERHSLHPSRLHPLGKQCPNNRRRPLVTW